MRKKNSIVNCCINVFILSLSSKTFEKKKIKG